MTNIIPCDSILIGGGDSSDVTYTRPAWGIQTVSYESGDAADQAANLYKAPPDGIQNRIDYSVATPMNTLTLNDPEFGGKIRFTSKTGTDVYGTNPSDTIIYDNLQGVIFDVVDFRNDNRRSLSAAWTIAQAKSETLNGKTYSDWYLAPMEYISSVVDEQWGTTEPRVFNSLGSGVTIKTCTQKTSGTQYFLQNNLSQNLWDSNTSQFNYIYIAFIEDGV